MAKKKFNKKNYFPVKIRHGTTVCIDPESHTQTVQIHHLLDHFQWILTPGIVYLYCISLGGRSGVHVPTPLLKKPLCSGATPARDRGFGNLVLCRNKAKRVYFWPFLAVFGLFLTPKCQRAWPNTMATFHYARTVKKCAQNRYRQTCISTKFL